MSIWKNEGTPPVIHQRLNADSALNCEIQTFEASFVKLERLDSFDCVLPKNLQLTTMMVNSEESCFRKEFCDTYPLNENSMHIKSSVKNKMIKFEKVDIKEEPLEPSEEYIESSDFLCDAEKLSFEYDYIKDKTTDIMEIKHEKPTDIREIKHEPSYFPETPFTNHNEHQVSTEDCDLNEHHWVDHLKPVDQKICKQRQRELKKLKSHALGPKMAICDYDKIFNTEENCQKKRRNIPFQNYSQMLNFVLPKGKRITINKKYNVEKIIAKRITSLGRSEYLVKWEGYTDKFNTWEPPSSFESLSLIFEFEKSRDREKYGTSSTVTESFKMDVKSTLENFPVGQRNILFEDPELRKESLRWYNKCMKCGRKFYNIDKFENHIADPHEFACLKCNKKFTTHEGLANHLKQLHNLTIITNKKAIENIPEVQMLVSEIDLAENILKDFEKWYTAKCVYCKTDILFSFLNKHITSAHPDKSVTCHCGFNGELHSILVHSYNEYHLPNENRPLILSSVGFQSEIIFIPTPNLRETRTFPCFKCSKIFLTGKSRNQHFHTCRLEKKYSCQICLENFALPSHLQKHIEVKHELKNCDYCGKTFTSIAALWQHVFHVHEKTFSKSNELFGKISVNSWLKDKNLNSQIGQSDCNKQGDITELLILTESDLDTSDSESRELTFSGDKKCKKCGDAFITFHQLKVHTRMHTREFPHACQHCFQKFISRNLLLKHKIKSHKEFLSKDESLRKSKGWPSVSSDSSDSDDSSIL